jgi:hypothetical protein
MIGTFLFSPLFSSWILHLRSVLLWCGEW